MTTFVDPMPMARAAVALLRAIEEAPAGALAYVPLTPPDERALRCMLADMCESFNVTEGPPGRFVISCRKEGLSAEDLVLPDAYGVRYKATRQVVNAYKNQALRTIIARKEDDVAAGRTALKLKGNTELEGYMAVWLGALDLHRRDVEWPTARCTMPLWLAVVREFKDKGLLSPEHRLAQVAEESS